MARPQISSPSQWLRGTWRSDRERTIAAWGEYPPGSKKFQAILLRDLGQLTIRYTKTRINSGNSGWTPYRVQWASADALFVVYGPKRSESGQLINFTSPTKYWIHAGRYVEHFSKVADV